MGTFAETTIVDYRLLFTDHGKQTSVFCFHLQQANGSLAFPFSVSRIQTEITFFHYFSFLLVCVCVCGGVGACVGV